MAIQYLKAALAKKLERTQTFIKYVEDSKKLIELTNHFMNAIAKVFSSFISASEVADVVSQIGRDLSRSAEICDNGLEWLKMAWIALQRS